MVLADHQNYYPDISFIANQNPQLLFAVDFKTSYRNTKKRHLCNGFTLGSHGKYFADRTSTKKITNIEDFVNYRNGDVSLIVAKQNRVV